MLIPVGSICAQSPRLIIRGDDMGYTHSANEALLESYKEGIMTTVEVMPITPWFPEVVKMCNANPDLDVGIHLSLTSEWTNLKWRPLTCSSSLTDNDGYFFPMIWPNQNYEGQALTENDWKLEEIEAEIRAQIELAIKKIPHISHVTSHMGWTAMDPRVTELVEELSREYGIDIDPNKWNVQRVRYEGEKKTEKEKFKSFSQMLKGLQKGKTYLFVDHPAYNTPEQQAVNHIGYEDVAVDRDGVARIWTDPEIKELVQLLDIDLINYKDLRD
ncbi:ChbG/HpnK family deacetylase [Zunongwangia sp. F260]|uniref:ChbG/HpnK family deacetylase n=1 Tax=Autumnicola lenta TaxID=3075593 RepID=A0ABU3CNQ0_9FLAO|nr:ChbG/HpnK family deacetylase [Zunongwangia sp. F260]MDT0647991.1 ChbG/HpnK family deacetylase [Zunongwangia sp. F260]